MEETSINKVQPTVDAEEPDKRKLARQLRIQRRLQHAKSARDSGEESMRERGRLTEIINSCNDKLFQIFVDGKELVTNIRVASDSREIERREQELFARNARLQQLEDEASLALEKLKAISAKWDNIVVSNDPLDLNHEMREQKARCMELIEQKNSLIIDFKNELKLADERFMGDREAMFEDISMLAKRIDEQVLEMKQSYLSELTNIEGAVDQARTEVLNKVQAEWNKLYDIRECDEISNMTKKFDLMKSTDEEVRHVYIKHGEKFRDTKIRLETDVQVLEQELEQIKALCLINSEKLDYNYQVLKKREDENVIIKSQQKRTLNKLQEELMILRRKIEEKQSAAERELSRLDKELSAYRKNVIDIEKKADHFSEKNDEKFHKIWDMKTEEAMDLLKKILSADKIIHEQILGIDWVEPSAKPLKKEELVSYQAAVNVVNELFSKTDSEIRKTEASTFDVENQQLLSHILSLIADHTGFLVEKKLDELLEPYSETERVLVRLDNVFNAIGVRSLDDMELLLRHFVPYAACRVCSSGHKDSSDTETSTPDDSFETKESQSLPIEEELSKLTCHRSHPLYIEKTFVLKALREFVSRLHPVKSRARAEAEVRLAKHRCTVSRLLSIEDLNLYWARFEEIFFDDGEAVWESLFDGMTNYHAILQERHKLNLKTQKLQQQNTELTRLAARYLPQESWRLPDLGRQGTPASTRDLIDILTRASR